MPKAQKMAHDFVAGKVLDLRVLGWLQFLPEVRGGLHGLARFIFRGFKYWGFRD